MLAPAFLAVLATLAPQAPPSSGPATTSPGATATAAAPDGEKPTPRARGGDEDEWRSFAKERLAEFDAAAERGLKRLAAMQLPSGCWTGHVGHKQGNDYELIAIGLPLDRQRAEGRGHLGVTALCGMAFLAGGHLPDRGPHREVVARTIQYVTSRVQENGFITDAGTRMYSHAFATLFLAEVYGMAGGKRVKDALERAVNLVVDCQNERGGWRYNPFDHEIDLSVTVCQVQALRAARNIGIRVPPQTIERAMAYVKRSQERGGRSRGLYHYKIHGRGAYDKPNEYAINAAAITALTSAGIYDDELIEPALEFVLAEYPRVLDEYREAQHFYFWYGNYYAAQAMYQSGGPRFRAFYERLARDLLAVERGGLWQNSVGPGDEFSTAVACILLHLPKQYLPIFQR